MVFPQTVLDAHVELFYSGVWNTVTTDVRGISAPDGRVRVGRGRPDEAGQTRPTTVDLALKNRDGKYSPRNSASALFGLIGRNTPARVSVGTRHLGAAAGSATASTSHVAPSVTASKAGMLLCAWAGALATESYTVPVSMTAGPQTQSDLDTMRSARETVAAGATGTRTATVTTATTHVAASVVAHGTSVVFQQSLSGVATTAAAPDVTLSTAAGTAVGDWLVAIQHWKYAAESKSRFMPDAPNDGEGGWILLADAPTVEVSVFRLQMRMWARRVKRAGAQQVTFYGIPTENNDNHAHLWRLSGVDHWTVRASVEISQWPARWDVSGTDVWSPVQGSGIGRRLGRAGKPLHSAIRRAVTGELVAGIDFGVGNRRTGTAVAYWPLEDAPNTTLAVSGLPEGHPMAVSGGTIAFAAADPPAGSARLPDLRNSTGVLTGQVDYGTIDRNSWTLTCVVSFAGTASWTALELTATGGPFPRLQLRLSSTIVLVGIDTVGIETTIGTLAEDLSDGAWYYLQVEAFNSGGDTVYRAEAHNADGTDRFTTSQFGNPVAGGGDPGPLTAVTVKSRGSGTSASLGHVQVYDGEYDEQDLLIVAAVDGYFGEAAGRRLERVCGEEAIPFHPVGDLATTAAMGAQGSATLMAVLRECETADLGVLYEPREALGLAYRTRASLYNQAATLALTYAADGELAHPLEPVEDDQSLTNDVTVARVGGGSARAVDDTGPLSVADPPDGVGTGYDTEISISVPSDLDLADQAGWRLHLGTVDEARFPQVNLNLAAMADAGKTALLQAAAAVDVGDLVSITAPPSWLPPDTISQLAQGAAEALSQFEWDMTVAGAPASPYTVGVYAGDAETPGPADPKRYDTSGSSTTASFVSGTNTTMQVATNSGPLWTTTAGDMPFDIRAAGVRLRATAIADPAPTLRDSTGTASGTTGSFTVAKPTGTAPGDVLVAFHASDVGGNQAPTGGGTWQLLSGTAGSDQTAWWRVAGGNEPASYTFTQNSNADGVAVVAAVAAARAVTPTAAAGSQTGSGTAVDTPTTTVHQFQFGSLELRWAAVETNVTFTPPAGFTEQEDLNSGGFVAGSLATRTTGEGNTGIHSFTASAAAASRRGVTVNVIGTQTVTVQQTPVNGVSKTIPSGSAVSLWTPARYAL